MVLIGNYVRNLLCVYPYSLTQYSCRQYLQDHVEKEFKERGVQHKFGRDLFKATNYLTPIVWESINEVILGAKTNNEIS